MVTRNWFIRRAPSIPGLGAGPATYWQRGKNWALVIPSDYVSPIVVLVALINTVSMGIRTAADTRPRLTAQYPAILLNPLTF